LYSRLTASLTATPKKTAGHPPKTGSLRLSLRLWGRGKKFLRRGLTDLGCELTRRTLTESLAQGPKACLHSLSSHLFPVHRLSRLGLLSQATEKRTGSLGETS
jgi:hypothetical protein